MNIKRLKHCYLILLFSLLPVFFSGCANSKLPEQLTGVYSGDNKLIIRNKKDGQFIFFEDMVMVNLAVSDSGEVSGMVGNSVFEGCKVKSNRGWIGRKLNIKTDFLLTGKLLGYINDRDTIAEKDISIPMNEENGNLTGSLFVTGGGQDYPIITFLKLKKH